MGGAKQAMIEAWERGHSTLEGVVCLSCLLDEDLLLLASSSIKRGTCAFCKATNRKVASAELIQKRIFSSLYEEYANVDNEGLPYCSEEGGYLFGDPTPIETVVRDVVGGSVSDEFLEELCSSCADEYWCKKDWVLLHPYERFVAGWEHFKETVKGDNRFAALEEPESDPGHPDSTSPRKTIELIGKGIRELKLFTTIKKGELIYRVRPHANNVSYNTQADLASPPPKKGGPNRLSGAGISMFYGAADENTAIRETCDGSLKNVSIGLFKVTAPFTVIDFTVFPKIPGYFSGASREDRAFIRFMTDFITELSSPIERDGSEHTEYAPTQLVADYLIRAANRPRRDALGIKFKSSKTGKANYALNLPRDKFTDPPDPSCPLKLQSAHTRSLTITIS